MLTIDSARQDVIQNTDDWVHDYARLYFRPKTPALHNIEGFCPEGICSPKYKAHCPIPIYLVFDSVKVLSMTDIKFSDESLAGSNCEVYDNVINLEYLPFEKIYHNFPVSELEKRNIVYHRHAEVVVPLYLPLENNLSFIVCRSEAERETLNTLLDYNIRQKYINKIKASPLCCFCKRQFISKVILNSDTIEIKYNRVLLAPFNYEYVIEYKDGKKSMIFFNNPVPKFKLNHLSDNYTFKILIDNHIAYCGEFVALPF